MSFEQLLGYYNIPLHALTPTQRQRARTEHAALMHGIAVEADSEARAWLWAYSMLRANDVHEDSRAACAPDDPLAYTIEECGPPTEQTEVQAELERLDVAAEQGDQIEELLDEREGCVWHGGRRQRIFLVKWSGYGYEHSTWQRAVELVQNGAGTVRARQLEVSALVARLRAQPAKGRYEGTLLKRRRAVERQYGVKLRAPLTDVLDFNLLPAPAPRTLPYTHARAHAHALPQETTFIIRL